ncbi:MAG: SRPBCC family protein [Cyclobacteriaceae bacterium]|nr:SRPBCC family protein [Cyclobacteriaceae bacterium]
MNKIELSIAINAPIERCFDLARSVDLHRFSMQHYHETIISGVQAGLMDYHNRVTWRARHFGVWFTLESAITKFSRPFYFTDEMQAGPFKKMVHDHFFYCTDSGTVMIDQFYFQSPYGWLGEIVDSLVLKNYLVNLLQQRNETIRQFAETDKWMEVLAQPEKIYKST